MTTAEIIDHLKFGALFRSYHCESTTAVTNTNLQPEKKKK